MARASDTAETPKNNGLAQTSPGALGKAEDVLQLRAAVFDSLKEAILVVDREGVVLDANLAWRQFQAESLWPKMVRKAGTDAEMLVIHEAGLGAKFEEVEALLSGLRSVICGEQEEFIQEFSVLQDGKPRGLRLWAEALPHHPQGAVQIAVRDISARRKAELDLRESHSLFNRIIEGTRDAIFIYDMEGRCLMHNSASKELLGMCPTQVVGKTIEEIFPEKTARLARMQNELALATGRTLEYELLAEAPQGNRTLLVQKGVYRNHRNEVVGIIGIARDITERKLAEEKLARSERHFRALIEKSADCIVLFAADGVIRYASPSSKEFSGFEPGELEGTNVFFWIHPDDLAETRQRFEELLGLPGATLSGEFRHLCKDGQWKWMEATATNWLNDPGVHAVVVNSRDITHRKEAEMVLRRHTAIVDASFDGIIGLDIQENITSWNPAAQRILGYPEKEILGKSFRVLVPEDRLAHYQKYFAQLLAGKSISDMEVLVLAKDGHPIEASLTASPIRSREHGVVGMAMNLRDITERRRLEREVLEIADFEKHRIGQDLHDDLCQHLVGISMIGNLLYAELARLGIKQAGEAKKVTEMIRNAVDHARILAKGLSPLNIAEGGLMGGLEMLAAQTEQLFRIPCVFECEKAVHIQSPEVATHLYRIAQEALHNAVKHSEGTEVVLRLATVGEDVLITVRDNGVGIPETKRPQGRGGLGMHTMHYRARIIGAALEISRNAGGGTTVACRLPNALAGEEPDAPACQQRNRRAERKRAR